MLLAAAVALLLGPGASPAPAQSDACPEVNPKYTGSCGPSFVLPGWGDGGGWKEPEQYETIQLADVDGDGKDELLGRTSAGLAVHRFDPTLGQWQPQGDAKNLPVILTAFADPPPLTIADPNPAATDWTLPQYYDTIQAADIDGDKRAEIIGRSAAGLLTFKFTPGATPGQGSWSPLTTSGPFTDKEKWDAGPFNYATIQAGDINGDGDAELIGRNGDGLQAWNWKDSAWKQLASFSDLGDKGGYNDPKYWPSIQLANIDGDRRDELVARDASGLSAYKYRSAGWTGISRFSKPFADQRGGGDCPFTSSGSTCFGAGPAYYGTIQFADVDGNGRAELLGRASDGLRVLRYRGDTPDAWGRLATLSALSDDNGYSVQKYWETIQFADINGDRRAEVLARDKDGLNAWSYDPATKAWKSKEAPTTALTLADDPWGSSRSYYSTIETGKVDGDGSADVIARGPYGIRTWFYNRAGSTSGWGSYLPSGYGDPELNSMQRTALDRLNALAAARGLITGNQATVREVWQGPNPPKTDTLDELINALVSLGGCTGKTNDVPPRYGTCASAPDGVSVADWTLVLNKVLAESFWAKLAIEYFADLEDVRKELILEETAQLTKMGNDIAVRAAANKRAEMSPLEFWSSATGIAGALAAFIPVVGEVGAAALEITSEVLSMVGSADEKLDDRFQGTFDEFQARFADAAATTQATITSHSELVRGDRGLLISIAQLYDRIGRRLDEVGMESAGRQAFALQVYKELLPTVYVRWLISGCRQTNSWQSDDCVPIKDTPGALWKNTDPQWNNLWDFTAIGAPPVPGGFHVPWPCWKPYNWSCHYEQGKLDAGLSQTLWGKIADKCLYQGSAAQQWTFGCSLGLDPNKTTLESPIAHQDWPFSTYIGNPVVVVCAPNSGCTPIGTVRPPPGDASASQVRTGRQGLALGRRTTLRLRGSFGRPPVRLARARVSTARLLFEPGGARELVRVGARMRRPRVTLLPGRGADGTRRTYTRRRPGGPRVGLRLRRRVRGALSFDLRVPRARVAAPAACRGTRPGVDRATGTVTLQTRLRIADGRRPPFSVTLNTRWRCRPDRLGAVRSLTFLRPRIRNPQRGKLALAVRSTRRPRAGKTGAYRIRISNRRTSHAYGVVVRAFLPRGYRALRARGGRGERDHVVWRLARLPSGRSKTVLLRLRVPPTAAGTRTSLVVGTHALNTRPSARKLTTRVRP